MAKRGKKDPQAPADQPKTLGEKIGEVLKGGDAAETEKTETQAVTPEPPKTETKTGKSSQSGWASHRKFDKFKK